VNGGDYMSFFKNFADNVKDTVSNIGEMYSSAGDAFSDGNAWAGLHRGFMATMSAIGNTVTFGGANYIGNAISDDINSGEADEHDSIASFQLVRQERGRVNTHRG
jgi:hypothetical protein